LFCIKAAQRGEEAHRGLSKALIEIDLLEREVKHWKKTADQLNRKNHDLNREVQYLNDVLEDCNEED
jgi:hypothetical protein